MSEQEADKAPLRAQVDSPQKEVPFRDLFPSVSALFRAHMPLPGSLRTPYSSWSNAIEYRNILVVGDQASGKTTLVQRLAQDLQGLYAPFAVSAWIETGGLASLLLYGTRDRARAWFLVGEDLTLVKVPKHFINLFFRVRHLIHANTGLNSGLAVTVFNSHTLHGIDKNLRTVFRMMFVKTIPTNPYDRALLKKYFDKELLDRFEKTAGDDDVLVWDRFHNAGVWAKVPLPTKNILRQAPVLPTAKPSIFVWVSIAVFVAALVLIWGSVLASWKLRFG